MTSRHHGRCPNRPHVYFISSGTHLLHLAFLQSTQNLPEVLEAREDRQAFPASSQGACFREAVSSGMRISSTTFNAHCFSRGISDQIALQRDRLLMGLAAHACCATAPAGENAAGRGVNAAGTPWPAQPGLGSRYFCLGLKGEACTLVPKEPQLERRATSMQTDQVLLCPGVTGHSSCGDNHGLPSPGSHPGSCSELGSGFAGRPGVSPTRNPPPGADRRWGKRITKWIRNSSKHLKPKQSWEQGPGGGGGVALPTAGEKAAPVWRIFKQQSNCLVIKCVDDGPELTLLKECE